MAKRFFPVCLVVLFFSCWSVTCPASLLDAVRAQVFALEDALQRVWAGEQEMPAGVDNILLQLTELRKQVVQLRSGPAPLRVGLCVAFDAGEMSHQNFNTAVFDVIALEYDVAFDSFLLTIEVVRGNMSASEAVPGIICIHRTGRGFSRACLGYSEVDENGLAFFEVEEFWALGGGQAVGLWLQFDLNPDFHGVLKLGLQAVRARSRTRGEEFIVDVDGLPIFVDVIVRPLASAEPLYGDVDNDGIVTVMDAVLVIRYIMGEVRFSSEQKQLADVYGDGAINVIDAGIILIYALGLIDDFRGAPGKGGPAGQLAFEDIIKKLRDSGRVDEGTMDRLIAARQHELGQPAKKTVTQWGAVKTQ